MKDIVIITHEPLTKNLKRIFYIDEYRKAGLDVRVWDISRITNKGMILSDQIIDQAITKLDSLGQLDKLLSENDNGNTIYLPQVPYSWHNRKVIKLLSDHKSFCIHIEYYANAYTKTSIAEKLKKYIQFKRYPELVRIKLEQKAYKIYCSKYKINIPQLNFTSSSLDRSATNYINHPDYESYMDVIENKNITSNKYIVFIDNYFPFHPDLIFHHGLNLDGAEEYQQSLKQLFNHLEKEYKIPVVIAAHPKAEYSDEAFGYRKIVKYKTAELVINSSYVIQHTSNSISFAILANKPIALITTKGYSKVKHLMKDLQKLSRIMKLPIFNIDNTNSTKSFKFQSVEENVRLDYIEKYLHRHELGNSRNADTLIIFFKKIEF